MRNRIKLIAPLVVVLGLLAAYGQAPTSSVPSLPSVVTREMLEKDLVDLQAQHDQMLANLHAIQGAMQKDRQWLSQLKQPEASK